MLCAKRKIYFMAKHELMRNPFIKFLAYAFEVIPVRRGEADVEAFKKSYRVLGNGEILGLFPEGTRKGMAKNEKLKNGAALMSVRTGAPIIPVGFKGSFVPFTKVTINFGKPMDFSEHKGKKVEKDVLNKITEEVMTEVVKLAM